MRRRREQFLIENNTSYLNTVKAGQFNFPNPTGGWANNNNLRDVIPISSGGRNLFFALRSDGTSYDVLVYEYNDNGGTNPYVGVIKSASDLTFRANLGSTLFTHSSVSQNPRSIQYVEIGGNKKLFVYTSETKIGEFDVTLDLDLGIASLSFDSSYDAGSFSSGNGEFFWFSEDKLKMWCGNSGGILNRSYTLSSPADLSTLSFVTQTAVSAAGRPSFFGGGTYALCKYSLGSGYSDLANYECSTPYDISTATLRYRRPFVKVFTNLRAALTLPVIMSNERRSVNWFTTGVGTSQAGGRIGYGWFDIPFNFRGESQTAMSDVRGVKFTDGTFVEP